MQRQDALRDILSLPPVQEALRLLEHGGTPSLGSLWGGGLPFLTASFCRVLPKCLWIITPDTAKAEILADDLGILQDRPLFYFPALRILDDDLASAHLESLAERWDALQTLKSRDAKKSVFIAPFQAMLQRLPDEKTLADNCRLIRVGQMLEPKELVEWLANRGFDSVAMVEGPGEYSLRGGILDVFYNPGDYPVRIEFFGNQIESLRLFSSATQMSVQKIEECSLHSLRATEQKTQGPLPLDCLPTDAVVILIDPEKSANSDTENWATEVYSRDEWPKILKRANLSLSSLPVMEGEGKSWNMNVQSTERFQTEGDGLKEALGQLENVEQLDIYCLNEGEKSRLSEIFSEFTDIGIAFHSGRLSSGCRFPELGRTILSSREIFNRYKTTRKAGRRGSKVPAQTLKPIQTFFDLKEGDYVVHVNHGIGKFMGMRKMEGDGREFFLLEYFGGAKLYVPVTNIDLMQKYIGGAEDSVTLDTLGSKSWMKRRGKAQQALQDLAGELLEIQARRETQRGIQYPPDDKWQSEFELSFPFEDTPDQSLATREICKDMTSPKPMDRLICGDVGFGKTELALRAVFRAVNAGKQAAVLVPTTILAQQHGETFRERMKDYPVKVEVISRFIPKPKQKEIMERLKFGEVDVLIGTHRILGKEFVFRDLGIVIIDEEQRFGVKHKESLKHFRETVEVLTLTATPIPRTLQMALTGIKDISTLSTPPAERLSIETEIRRFDGDLIRRAIRFELARGGQIFFVHPRVSDIETLARKIGDFAPEAKVGVAHGQMDEDLLSRRMLDFVNREFDVLVSTNIIESGLDIQNANTIFINNADMFGLADLHQLRGRVGRYKYKAHAYFLIDPKKHLEETALKRLKAIQEFRELGAGFKIAMRDLEIRGAGNLLGAEQTGHIKEIGYDLYCKLLQKCVEEMKNRDVSADDILGEDVQFDLKIAAVIPETYIPDTAQRIEAYRKASQCRTENHCDNFLEELRDRYGPVPEGPRRLLEITLLKHLAYQKKISRVAWEGKNLWFDAPSMKASLPHFSKVQDRIRILDGRRISIFLKPRENTVDGLLNLLKKVLN